MQDAMPEKMNEAQKGPTRAEIEGVVMGSVRLFAAGQDELEILPTSRFADHLGMNLPDKINLLIKVEDELGIVFPLEATTKIHTVWDVVSMATALSGVE
jgi:acyl carrier protein